MKRTSVLGHAGIGIARRSAAYGTWPCAQIACEMMELPIFDLIG
jgi:hypothetical protein